MHVHMYINVTRSIDLLTLSSSYYEVNLLEQFENLHLSKTSQGYCRVLVTAGVGAVVTPLIPIICVRLLTQRKRFALRIEIHYPRTQIRA